MRSNLHDLAIEVGFEVVNVEDGYTDYEYNEKLSGVESVSYIIKVIDKIIDIQMVIHTGMDQVNDLA